MGIFENSLKNKDAKDLYESIRTIFTDVTQNANFELPADLTMDQEKFEVVSILRAKSATSEANKSTMKHIKRALEHISPEDTLLQLDFSGKSISFEGALAILKCINARDERNQLKYRVSSLNFGETGFYPVSTSLTPSEQASKPKNHWKTLLETMISRELCEYLAGTTCLELLDLSNNNLGQEFVTRLMLDGIRKNHSLVSLKLSKVGLEGTSLIVPNTLAEILLCPRDCVKVMTAPRQSNVSHVNNSLRSVDFSGAPWNDQALELFYKIAVACFRMKSMVIKDDGSSYKNLEAILARNTAATEIMDDIFDSVFRRPFRTKLNNFKDTVKTMKSRSGDNPASEPNTPVYKLFAAGHDKTRPDPFAPVVFPSATWKAGYALSIGKRDEMQDVVAMRGKFREVSEEGTLKHEDWWAVFDGHGGREAANYAAENLHQAIASQLDKLPGNAASDKRGAAIKAAFKQCNKEMAPWNSIVGTTCVGLYVHDKVRYAVNLGDSRAIVFNSKNEYPTILTKDHKPSDAKEKARVMQIPGAFIEDGKLNGKLAVTRSLGDSALDPFVSHDPDVDFAPIDDDDEFMVLASDGLWDVFHAEEPNASSNRASSRSSAQSPASQAKLLTGLQEIVKIVMLSTSASSAAKNLVDFAMQQGAIDNISVVVVFLKQRSLVPEQVSTQTKNITNLVSQKDTSAAVAKQESSVNINTNEMESPAVQEAPKTLGKGTMKRKNSISRFFGGKSTSEFKPSLPATEDPTSTASASASGLLRPESQSNQKGGLPKSGSAMVLGDLKYVSAAMGESTTFSASTASISIPRSTMVLDLKKPITTLLTPSKKSIAALFVEEMTEYMRTVKA